MTVIATGYNDAYEYGVEVSELGTVTVDFALASPSTPQDINGNENINLADAIFALKILTGTEKQADTSLKADINGDSRIGLEEAVYILQYLAGFR
ncbi:MAG: hypothetical protein GY852_05570 [bacterium]|nr:hypothetical protein [bacterium]